MTKVLRAPGIVLFLLCLMYFITYMDRVNIATAAPFIKAEFDLSNTQLGLVFSAFAYPYAIFQVIGGSVGDKFGARRILFICGFLWAVATVVTGLVGSLDMLIAARVMLGFGEGATFPVATRAMTNWTSPSRRGFAQGITHSFARLGNAVTPPAVALLIALTSWRGAFIVLGAISMVWVVTWVIYFRDDPRQHRSITEEDLKHLPAYGEANARSKRRTPWKRLTLRMLPASLTYFCYAWTLWLLLNWLPSFFKEAYHLDLKNSAFFASGVFFAGAVGDTLGGVISDRLLRATGSYSFARLSVIIVGMLGAAACLLGVLLVSKDLAMIALLLSGGFFFLELVIGPIWSIPMDIAPEHAGTASGLLNTGSAIAAIVSPVAFGKIVDLTGDWHLPFAVSIGLLLLGTVLSFTIHPDRKFFDPATSPGKGAAVPPDKRA
jgi:sugar phosphate permease